MTLTLPPPMLPLLKRCSQCGADRPLLEYAIYDSGHYFRACKSCRNIRSHVSEAHRRDVDVGFRKKNIRRTYLRRRRKNEALRLAATENGKPWTTSENNALLDSQFTAGQLAQRLGRTLVAVQQQRKKLGKMLGIPTPGHLAKCLRVHSYAHSPAPYAAAATTDVAKDQNSEALATGAS